MFQRQRLSILVSAALLSMATGANAATTYFDNFTPLAASAGPIPVGGAGEATPMTLSSPNFSQLSIADRTTQTGAGQFNSGAWDMITQNETGPDAGRYLFTVFETGQAGIQRTDLQTGVTKTIWQAPAAAPALSSFVAYDASYWTPWGTFITAEESWGGQPQPYGRLVEITNPLKENGTVDQVHRNIIPRTSHEGIQFDAAKNMYFIDELNGGTVFKYTSMTPDNGLTYFSAGQTSVLRVGDGFTPNATGAYQWVAITDAQGEALPDSVVITDPNFITSIDGRASADVAALKGTDYQRPEDLQVQTVGGVERMYMATTTTNEVYVLDLATQNISVFANQSTIDLATGAAVGSALRSPDNLAMDAEGNIYIIEDRNGGVDNDIWFAKDINKDGDLLDAGEGIGRWATNGTQGSEFTGLYFDITNPNRAWVNIQHPSSGVDRMMEISAVPEPETYAMLGAGLGMIGLMRFRRRAGR
jgi:secreted PhoX family phosphatase